MEADVGDKTGQQTGNKSFFSCPNIVKDFVSVVEIWLKDFPANCKVPDNGPNFLVYFSDLMESFDGDIIGIRPKLKFLIFSFAIVIHKLIVNG